MKINEVLKKYISGEKIGYQEFYFDKQTEVYDRLALIKKILNSKKNASVIHLGCCDHIHLISKKRKEKRWLHDILLKNSKTVVGIDINKEAIDYLKNIGIPNLICADITKDVDIIKQELSDQGLKEKWDFLICGEIIEHVNNPVGFLNVIKQEFADCVDKIIITVPNALRYTNFINALKGYEKVNSDHRYWFTPYTILKVISESGIEVEDIYFTGLVLPAFIDKIAFFNKAILSSEIVVIGKL